MRIREAFIDEVYASVGLYFSLERKTAALGFVRFVGEVRGGAGCGVSVKRKPDRS
jgi:hypothetical protein